MQTYSLANLNGSRMTTIMNAVSKDGSSCDVTYKAIESGRGIELSLARKFIFERSSATDPCAFRVKDSVPLSGTNLYADVYPLSNTNFNAATLATGSTNPPGITATPPLPINMRNVSGFQNYERPPPPPPRREAPVGRLTVMEAPLTPFADAGFGRDFVRNRTGYRLADLYETPLYQPERVAEKAIGPAPYLTRPAASPEQPIGKSYKYLRFRPLTTRDPVAPAVSVARFSFFLGKHELDIARANVTNPMGGWVGRVSDVTASEGVPWSQKGWRDEYKKAIVFAFAVPILVDGFSWTTAHMRHGLGEDPMRWKLEGSHNGTFWEVLHDQSLQNYNVPRERLRDLPVFRF